MRECSYRWRFETFLKGRRFKEGGGGRLRGGRGAGFCKVILDGRPS